MPYFRITAHTPYCGEELNEYIELAEDELDQLDDICDQAAIEVADMFWDGEWDEELEDSSDGSYTGQEYYAECYAEATGVSKEEYEENK